VAPRWRRLSLAKEKPGNMRPTSLLFLFSAQGYASRQHVKRRMTANRRRRRVQPRQGVVDGAGNRGFGPHTNAKTRLATRLRVNALSRDHPVLDP